MNVAGFGSDPFWLICLKVLGVFVLLVLIVLFTIWWERRVVARMQHRRMPVGRHGEFVQAVHIIIPDIGIMILSFLPFPDQLWRPTFAFDQPEDRTC